MKVLVVDDNIAIQEILKDILIDEGHIVRIAGTIDDAVEAIMDFEPNAILLDTLVNDEDGLKILDRVHEREPMIELNTILVKGINDESPKDNPFIMASVNKPFKSSDISAALKELVAKKEQEQVEKAKGSKKKKGFFSKKRKEESEEESQHITVDETAMVAEYIASDAPLYGRSYVFFEKEPNKIYDFIDIFSPKDYSILVITTENAKAARKNFGNDDIEIATLSATGRGRSMNINALGTLTVFIKDFVREHEKPIVMIEDLTNIIDSNGLNHSLVFVHQLVSAKSDNKIVTYVVSVNPSILTTKDRNILLGDMSEYSN